jgi:hypothetical protein
MFEDLLRIIGVAIVGLILVLPPGNYLDILYDRNNQIVVGLVVVASILFIDPIFGALLGLAVFIWFFKMNYRKLVSSSLSSNVRGSSPVVYGTSKNLQDAQTNVIDTKMMNTEMIGFDGIYGEQVIGAQGLDSTMPGYDKKDIKQASI